MNDPVPLSFILVIITIFPAMLMIYFSTALQRLNSAQFERLFGLEEDEETYKGITVPLIITGVHFSSVVLEILFLLVMFTRLIQEHWTASAIGFFCAFVLIAESFARLIIPNTFPLHLRDNLNGFEKWLFLMCGYVFFPLSWITNRVSRMLEGILQPSNQNDRMAQAEETIKSIIDAGEKDGVFLSNEGEMLQSIVDLSDTIVREVMTPRIDLQAIEISHSVDDFVQKVVETGYSKIPVFKDRIDDVSGVLYAKDALNYLGNSDSDLSLEELKRDATFVPETKRISILLKEFQKDKNHIAIVVDEFGGVAGLVTIEDLLEEIVGEIQDEYDQEESAIRALTPDSWEVAARIDLDELTEEINLEFPDDNYETLGGFLFHQFGSVPRPGETHRYKNAEFKVINADERKIDTVIITKNEDREDVPGEKVVEKDA